MTLTRTLVATAIAACAAFPAVAQQVTFMTGPQGGSWVPLGGALKGMWEKSVPGLQIQQQPGAGIANVRGVDDGKALVTQPKGNTAEAVTAMVLEINGLSYQSLSRTNFQAAYTDAIALMKDGNAQVFTLGTTAPA